MGVLGPTRVRSSFSASDSTLNLHAGSTVSRGKLSRVAEKAQDQPPACLCKHSLAAHLVGPARSCGFCSCAGFSLPAELIPRETGMSEQLMLALEVLAKSPAFE